MFKEAAAQDENERRRVDLSLSTATLELLFLLFAGGLVNSGRPIRHQQIAHDQSTLDDLCVSVLLKKWLGDFCCEGST